MKNLLHNIQTWLTLALLIVGIQSCTYDGEDVGNVEVTFTATLPVDSDSRSFGKARQINTLLVGVFSDEHEEICRKSFPVNGTSVDITLALAQNQKYNFVFFAYDSRQEVYNLDDLTAIRMNAIPSPITFAQSESMDAFFATRENVFVIGDKNYPIELIRPLVQINIGTTGKPMLSAFTVKSIPDTFYPFMNTVSGATDFSWNISETTAEKFSVEGEEYNYLGMGYVFAPTTATPYSVELTLTDAGISQTVNFSQVYLEANFKSNIVGKFTNEL